ncbi:MAG TPA: tail fiber protein [Actinomycetota bacterium]|nr:tail fiber protein [Actinomycetota bacterium]
MAQPYIGEIRMFAGNFAPAGWLFCNGEVLPIAENDALFTLIGTTYGGDGQETFALPNLCSRIPVHQGQNVQLGEMGGSESVTLTVNQLPRHNHLFLASSNNASMTTPNGTVVGTPTVVDLYRTSDATDAMASCVGPSGGNQPHENVPPFLCINFIISLFGIFPSQT